MPGVDDKEDHVNETRLLDLAEHPLVLEEAFSLRVADAQRAQLTFCQSSQ
jgi:hypothetical protein